jgi:DNA-binding response OmpR family regulator
MCEVRVRGRPVRMSLTHLRMLATLLRAEGRVVPREDLYEQATRKRARIRSRTVDVQIFHIRRALGPYSSYLISVPGRGYRVDVLGLSKAR